MKIRALLLLLACTPSLASAAITPSMPNPRWPEPADRGDQVLKNTALRLHNYARNRFGVQPISWNPWLASEARAYAQKMADTGIYRHDPTPGRRKKMGENIWQGPRGVFSYEVMIGLMIDEVEHFVPGAFPNNARNGNWHLVSHYTQIVWPTTTEVGCALVPSATTDYFVCRYAPTGNKDGVVLRPNPTIQLAQGGD